MVKIRDRRGHAAIHAATGENDGKRLIRDPSSEVRDPLMRLSHWVSGASSLRSSSVVLQRNRNVTKIIALSQVRGWTPAGVLTNRSGTGEGSVRSMPLHALSLRVPDEFVDLEAQAHPQSIAQ